MIQSYHDFSNLQIRAFGNLSRIPSTKSIPMKNFSHNRMKNEVIEFGKSQSHGNVIPPLIGLRIRLIDQSPSVRSQLPYQ